MSEEVLLVGFGGPEAMGAVPAFVESVLGRTPPPHVTPAVLDRYRAIGGGSPLPATTRRQAELLASELERRGQRTVVRVGMLHARPTIVEAAAAIRSNGAGQVTVLSLAPYRCEVSTDAYEAAAQRELGDDIELRFVPDWNLAGGYIDALSSMLSDSLDAAPSDTPVVFTAHSLPQRMIDQGDPYADQLMATARAVADRLGLTGWSLAYQSVSAAAREPWLGPAVEEMLDQLAAAGAESVMVDPIGFLSDHVETLYDNDIEHRAYAEARAIDFHRCRCLNTHPRLIETLADLVLGA
jgi:ferrochelatase